jgi:ribosomal protein S27E
MAAQGKDLPLHVQQEFADYLKCGCLDHDFLRVQCTECHHEHLVAFSCKRLGFCPSCGARRMAESASLAIRSTKGVVIKRNHFHLSPTPFL